MKKHSFESLKDSIFSKAEGIEHIKGGMYTLLSITRVNTDCKPLDGGTCCEDQNCMEDLA